MGKTPAERQREYRERHPERVAQNRRDNRQRNLKTVREKEAEYAYRRRRELDLLAPPLYICVDCEGTFERSNKGRVPQRCPGCRQKRHKDLRRGRNRIYAARPHRQAKAAVKMANRTPEQKAAAAAATRKWYRENVPQRRLRAMEILGGVVCQGCGITDERVLTFDHINGDGAQERALYGAGGLGQRMIREMVNDPDAEKWRKKYRVLCFNCNWIAHLELQKVAV